MTDKQSTAIQAERERFEAWLASIGIQNTPNSLKVLRIEGWLACATSKEAEGAAMRKSYAEAATLIGKMVAEGAAKDAEIAWLQDIAEAAAALVSNEDHAITAGIPRTYGVGSATWELWQGLRESLAALTQHKENAA